MKSKKLSLILVLILVLIVASFFYTKFKSKKDVNTDSPKTENALFASVKEAMGKKLTLSCEFQNEGSTVKSYIKNGGVRISTVNSDGTTAEFLQKDGKMYIWDTKSKQGFVSSLSSNETDSNIKNQDLVSTEKYLDLVDQYKDSCKVGDVSDQLFSIPADVSFKDLDQFMKDIQSQIPNLPNN